MSEVPHGGAGSATPRGSFPAVRLFYAVGFAIAAWFVFWVVVVLAIVQFAVLAVDGRTNAEVKNLSANLIQYLWELLAFIAFLREERPFPFGSFPQANGLSA